MDCLHPHCKMPGPHGTWSDVAAHPDLKIAHKDRPALAMQLDLAFRALSNPARQEALPPLTHERKKTLFRLCPCLFNQVDEKPTPRAIVHFCEMTLGAKITANNVHKAFEIQHPKSPTFKFPMNQTAGNGGTVMEMLCSEVLVNESIPRMILGSDGWPEWQVPGHILLNEGKMSELQALGDILIPCAPTNLVISVKSEAARERLLYSANSIEGIGFGFFNQPEEFWTESRMKLYKRMGFLAIYLPDHTHDLIHQHLVQRKTSQYAVNLNGTQLYRPISVFGEDMRRVVGRSSLHL